MADIYNNILWCIKLVLSEKWNNQCYNYPLITWLCKSNKTVSRGKRAFVLETCYRLGIHIQCTFNSQSVPITTDVVCWNPAQGKV